MSYIKEIDLAGKTLRFEFQKYAKQANGSVLVSCGDTQVLVTAAASDKPKPDQSFFPLTVDYIEKFYAAGRIPGGFFKREAKPSDQETLTARVIDRALRPCFPEGYLNETQIVCTVISLDPNVHPAPLASIGASFALMISDIPFDGPICTLRIGRKNGEHIVDPKDGACFELDLTVAAREGAVVMVEAGANFLSEDDMLNAIDFAQNLMKPIFKLQSEVQKEIGKPKKKIELPAVNETLKNQVNETAYSLIKEAFSIKDKLQRRTAVDQAKTKVFEALNALEDSDKQKEISKLLEDLQYKVMRDAVIQTKTRIDGRNPTEIRPIKCEVGNLKRAHGSGLFQRGETQVLGVVTLGAVEDEQKIDSILNPMGSKRFLLHYNFPPYSVGEARPLRGISRREIGHGALADRALEKIIPDHDDFGYTIRLVAEVLESNGSSSMATVCAGVLSLLHAGVPLKKMVSGIAMGLVKEGDDYVVLSDILGDEDHLGDMDFKVCGDENGITALQMDIKIAGLTREILEKALRQAKEGRQFILSKIKAAISEPLPLSPYAPRIFQIRIKNDKVRDLIGPGGKNIKRITAEAGVKIDVADDGVINVVSPDVASAEAAKSMIRSVTSDPEIGEVYLGTVKKVMDFGVFVEIKPGVEGLCHIAHLDKERVSRVEDVVKEGEEIMVKVIEIDRQGKIKLSRKDAVARIPN